MILKLLDFKNNISKYSKEILLGLVLILNLGSFQPVLADGGYTVTIDTFKETDKKIEGKDGIDLITEYIKVFYKAAAGIIGIICVLIMVISGIQISMGGLDPEGVNQAKDRIIQALLSMALLFSSAAILKTINSGFFT